MKSNRESVMRDLDSIVSRWKEGVPLADLAVEYHVSLNTMRPCVLTVMSLDEYRAIDKKHRCDHALSKGRKFKKGNVPKNRECGHRLLTVRVVRRYARHKRGGRPRLVRRRYIKVANTPGAKHGNWVPLSRWLWEREHGPVPAGHFVGYIDGDESNDSLENLELVSRVENARRATTQCDQGRRAAKIRRARKKNSSLELAIRRARKSKREEVSDGFFSERPEWGMEEVA